MADDLNFHKKRSKVTHSSLTKLSTRVTELEADRLGLYNAQNTASKLKKIDGEFRNPSNFVFLFMITQTSQKQRDWYICKTP